MSTISLQTHDSSKKLTLESIAKYRGGSGYSCKIIVQSVKFSAEYYFFFSESLLDEAILNLEKMCKTLQGEAILGEEYEPSIIALSTNQRGHVKVEGVIQSFSYGFSQRLEFEFQTDQTVLQPLIKDLKRIQDMPPVALN